MTRNNTRGPSIRAKAPKQRKISAVERLPSYPIEPLPRGYAIQKVFIQEGKKGEEGKKGRRRKKKEDLPTGIYRGIYVGFRPGEQYLFFDFIFSGI